MTIAYLGNEFMLHFSFLCDELYKLTNGNFWFIEANEMNNGNRTKIPSTFDLYKKPYLIQAWRSLDDKAKAMNLVRTVDVMLIGAGYAGLEYGRVRLETGKLTFEPTERQLKRGIFNAFSKVTRGYARLYLTSNHNNVYRLCSSAFLANDVYFLYPFFKDKCYKWGYFTKVSELNIDEIVNKRRNNDHIKIMCIGRLINWKRIDLPIRMVAELKRLGYIIDLNIIGEGALKEELECLIHKLKVDEMVHMLGNVPNEKVYELLQEHDIFVLPSNKREGWGAVLNEAMSNGCACVASDLVGAAPFLIDNGRNGFLFRTGDVNDLTNKIKSLIDNIEMRESFQKQAYKTMIEIWNPSKAAENLVLLSKSILSGTPVAINEGPCSKAVPIKGKTFAK